jgi:dipeptide/tripeptide permease
MTTGFMLAVAGGAGYTILNYYAYKKGPCGHYGSSASCVDADDVSLVSDITIWWMAIPYALGGISELFVNVPAYGIAYSRAPKNMRGLVAALNLFTTAIAYAIGLACSGVIKDPYITWDFGAPTIIGLVAAIFFYWMYYEIDKEEYTLTKNGDYHLKFQNGAHQQAISDDGASQEESASGKPEYVSKDTGVAHEKAAEDKELS